MLKPFFQTEYSVLRSLPLYLQGLVVAALHWSNFTQFKVLWDHTYGCCTQSSCLWWLVVPWLLTLPAWLLAGQHLDFLWRRRRPALAQSERSSGPFVIVSF